LQEYASDTCGVMQDLGLSVTNGRSHNFIHLHLFISVTNCHSPTIRFEF